MSCTQRERTFYSSDAGLESWLRHDSRSRIPCSADARTENAYLWYLVYSSEPYELGRKTS